MTNDLALFPPCPAPFPGSGDHLGRGPCGGGAVEGGGQGGELGHHLSLDLLALFEKEAVIYSGVVNM